MATTKAPTKEEVTIIEMERGRMDFRVLGTSPLICNRMSQKALHELLLPKGRKNAAEKASSLKHDPVKEFRDSPYILTDDTAPTYLAVLPTMFKAAMLTAALDMPGTKKTQMGRLLQVDWPMQPVFGLPKLFMSVVRSADMNKTPDIRTRAIIPHWACYFSVEYTKPLIKEQSVANLLAAAGMTSGIGDWRQEKGSGSFGGFTLVGEDNEDFKRIIKTGGRQAQLEAMVNADPYDRESAEMLTWFSTEAKKRGFKATKSSSMI